ncbi:hypothetical protein [Sphingomonas oligophenolica]|uniref:Uncharacterized protein n=1 Tax=Sphingomonas oligophenolica TaxID=301154 RepID=A0A502CH42_9SPHN|nr:hypothetical protein [Sphingomonas oligophenolica]TPG11960.1 hypothetical protein EAH84_10740 [Sphingomonas oligophenolica]
MDQALSTLERALQLARGGQCKSVNDVRQALRREGYDAVHQHLHGAAINRQLIDLLAEARADFSAGAVAEPDPPELNDEPVEVSDADLLTEYQRTKGDGSEAESIFAEIQRRNLDI